MEYDVNITSTGKDTLAVKRTKLKETNIKKYIYLHIILKQYSLNICIPT